MLVSRLSGLVLPASSKFLIDDVIGKHRHELLPLLALAAGAATLIDAATSFALSQILGVAAQHAITDMRRSVEAHVVRLPVQYFDSTQTGVLISRIMTDAEGIRNLVGTGLVQLTGSVVTGILALGVLFYLNWKLTLFTLIVLSSFGGIMSIAFKKLRPLFRERGKINAEVTGRLAESLGGIRIVKAYTAEKREQIVFTHGVHRLFRNVAKSITGVSATGSVSTIIVGATGVIVLLVGGRAILEGRMTLGDLVMYTFFTGLMAMPLVQIASIGTQITEAFAGLDRINEIKQMVTEDEQDKTRRPLDSVRGDIAFDNVSFEYEAGVPVLKKRVVRSAVRLNDCPRRFERFREEHADRPRDGISSPAHGPRHNRRHRPAIDPAARVPVIAGCRDAGEFPFRRHHRRQHPVFAPGRLARGDP